MNSNEVFIHFHQGCFAGTGAIVRLPQCQWSKPDGYGKISQCITTTKHSKAKTVCIFLGIYYSFDVWHFEVVYFAPLVTFTTPCPDMFYCHRSKECIHASWYYDGMKDCVYGEDERGCFTPGDFKMPPCWQCHYRALIYNDVIMSAVVSQITSLTIVYSTVNSGTEKIKHQSSASLAFVRGIHWWPVNSFHKG